MAITVYLSIFFLALYIIGIIIKRVVFRRDRQRMEEESRVGGRVIAKVDEVRPGSVKKFWLICQKYRIDAFLVNDRGNFFAYVNRCRHVGISLDWVDNQFFTEDGRYLICANHGALYEPATGECVWGPCTGASLYRVPLQIKDGKIFARCPESNQPAD